MRRLAHLALCALLLAATVPLLSACGNTMRGAGRDIERMGQAVQNAAP
ncbi:entericidin A/B family lipoprotein [Radicibacter daui]